MKISRGFTLVELMVTLAIAAILLTVGVPSMTTFIKNNRLTAATNAFVSSLTLARSEAVKQSRNAIICTGTLTGGCAAGPWTGGWIVMVDADGDTIPEAPAEVQRVYEALPNTLVVTTAFNNFQFDSTGAANNTGNFTICDDRVGNFGRQLRILNTGATSLTTQVACP